VRRAITRLGSGEAETISLLSFPSYTTRFVAVEPTACPTLTKGKYAYDFGDTCKEEGISRTILFNLCGHGHFDMQSYIDYHAGRLQDSEYSEQEIAMALSGLPVVS
jgi:predicted alternative tryptophan synthase beta-subunit